MTRQIKLNGMQLAAAMRRANRLTLVPIETDSQDGKTTFAYEQKLRRPRQEKQR